LNTSLSAVGTPGYPSPFYSASGLRPETRPMGPWPPICGASLKCGGETTSTLGHRFVRATTAGRHLQQQLLYWTLLVVVVDQQAIKQRHRAATSHPISYGSRTVSLVTRPTLFAPTSADRLLALSLTVTLSPRPRYLGASSAYATLNTLHVSHVRTRRIGDSLRHV